MTAGPVVALVASAGGLDAVGSVLGALPARLPAAVLVILHQDPDSPSRLPQILAARTDLPVAHARDGTPWLAGHVLVAPPGRHLLVTAQRQVALLSAGPFPPNRPSADLLLVSMALSLGPDAIAAVLSGGGHDGATGAVAVHDFGGHVLVSNAATSTFSAMPLATLARSGAHAEALPVDDLAARIIELTATDEVR